MCAKQKLVTMLKVKIQVFEEHHDLDKWKKKAFLGRKQNDVQEVHGNKEKENQNQCSGEGEGRTVTTRTSSSHRGWVWASLICVVTLRCWGWSEWLLSPQQYWWEVPKDGDRRNLFKTGVPSQKTVVPLGQWLFSPIFNFEKYQT